MPHESGMTPERWFALMDAWGFGKEQATFDGLVAAYSEKGRYYHTADHISSCLRHLDAFFSELDCPREVELALWFHDAIYNPFSNCNERDSADWAASFLLEQGASPETADRVHRLIMVTEHNAPTQTNDETTLVDIDLSILGAEPRVYEVFEQNIRKEYKHVPSFIYRKKRAAILRGFLDRPKIYDSDCFSDAVEQQARRNLLKALSNLDGRG